MKVVAVAAVQLLPPARRDRCLSSLKRESMCCSLATGAACGLCQALITLIKREPPGVRSIGINRDAQALGAFACDYPVESVHDCAHGFLASFVFLDLLRSLPCRVMVSAIPRRSVTRCWRAGTARCCR